MCKIAFIFGKAYIDVHVGLNLQIFTELCLQKIKDNFYNPNPITML